MTNEEKLEKMKSDLLDILKAEQVETGTITVYLNFVHKEIRQVFVDRPQIDILATARSGL